jgi:hypothetical protein
MVPETKVFLAAGLQEQKQSANAARPAVIKCPFCTPPERNNVTGAAKLLRFVTHLPSITQASLKCACLIDFAAGSPSTSLGRVRLLK